MDTTTLAAQTKATDPAQSAWVSANAGSGKTFVLSRRVIRLLLQGTDPSCVLCLTFTKAAAAEMAKRVFGELARWTTLADADLRKEIAAIEEVEPGVRKLAEARRLFAKALDTPGGLKIQTIHAFCERLLHQFPFEANVAGHFEVLDERNAKALKDEARRAVLARAAAEPATGLGAALATILAKVSDRTHEDSLEQFIDARDALRAWFVTRDDLDDAIEHLRESLGVAEGETASALRHEVVDSAPLDRAAARRLIGRLSGSGAQDVAAAERLTQFAESDDVEARCEAWIDFFFTGRDLRKSFVTKKIRDAVPGLAEMLDTEGERLVELVDRINTVVLREITEAMLRMADGAIAEYERLKTQRGVLDFEDLIVRTANLLARADAGRWVHYKLDRGIEHILVDEAQDTSPRQWQVIASLVAEFFAGEGANSERVRTLFAVGDEKQSIFSFQGAVPAWFDRMRRELGKRARDATYAWQDLELHLSFRSVPKILDAVDAVFASSRVHQGLTAEARPTVHTARRRNEVGRVVVWPRYDAPAKPDTDDWVKPLDHLGGDSPEVRLAQRIAATIRDWLDRGEALDAPDDKGKPRPIRPSEILILTRSRGALTDAINRELKRVRVPIAGADRIRLTEHIAVMDLMAVARVVLLPEDDLSLAAALKSPLIGIDEEALYRLARGRVGSLWDALAGMAKTNPALAAAKAKFDTWRDRADFRDPHAFFARILAADEGRRAFLTRLGMEAEDVLDEFLAEALAYEQVNVPSLEGFLAWLDAGETDVRRDPDSLREEVRVMTVHGAKGLEADVVFLVDNGTPTVISNYVSRVLPLSAERDPQKPGPVVWVYSTPAMPALIAARVDAQKIRDEEEYRRLLYVGMTRARDRLYVVGMKKQNLNDDRRWHVLVEEGLSPRLTDRTLPNGDIEREWRPEPAPPAARGAANAASPSVVLPPWARMQARAAPPPLVRLAPSSALAGTTPSAARAERRDADTGLALERGRLAHRLLQSLPDVPTERRAEIGARYLSVFAKGWVEDDRGKLLAEVIAVLDHSDFAEAFGKNSRAEVEIAGRLSDARVAGRIDRLAVTPDRVLIVDYKTNRPAPEKLADVPPAYITQLAIYRAILERLYPNRVVAAALLWTDGPSLMEIPEEALKTALP
jgi:ATP-dependent helicase/nuclease subunit A